MKRYLIMAAVALAAIYVANNVAAIKKIVGPKVAA
jgi:hypothetical protein